MIKQVESARMSWCLSDVVDLHGPAGLRSRMDPIGAAEAPAIYPTEMPPEAASGYPMLAPTPAEGIPAGELPPTVVEPYEYAPTPAPQLSPGAP